MKNAKLENIQKTSDRLLIKPVNASLYTFMSMLVAYQQITSTVMSAYTINFDTDYSFMAMGCSMVILTNWCWTTPQFVITNRFTWKCCFWIDVTCWFSHWQWWFATTCQLTLTIYNLLQLYGDLHANMVMVLTKCHNFAKRCGVSRAQVVFAQTDPRINQSSGDRDICPAGTAPEPRR